MSSPRRTRAEQRSASRVAVNRIIVMCRSGARSALAGARLKNMGFGDVRNLVGGFTAWTAAGLPTAEHTADL